MNLACNLKHATTVELIPLQVSGLKLTNTGLRQSSQNCCFCEVRVDENLMKDGLNKAITTEIIPFEDGDLVWECHDHCTVFNVHYYRGTEERLKGMKEREIMVDVFKGSVPGKKSLLGSSTLLLKDVLCPVASREYRKCWFPINGTLFASNGGQILVSFF